MKPSLQRSSLSGNLNPCNPCSSSSTLTKSGGSSSSDSFPMKDKNRSYSNGTRDRQNIRPEPIDVMKMLNFGSVTPIDGLVKPFDGLVKSFDTKFLIAKLSARSQIHDTKKDQIHLNSTTSTSSSIKLSSLMSAQTQSGSTAVVKMRPKRISLRVMKSIRTH